MVDCVKCVAVSQCCHIQLGVDVLVMFYIGASICIILTIVKNKNKLKVYLIYMLNGCTNSND